jgi:hypothetical protein
MGCGRRLVLWKDRARSEIDLYEYLHPRRHFTFQCLISKVGKERVVVVAQYYLECYHLECTYSINKSQQKHARK